MASETVSTSDRRCVLLARKLLFSPVASVVGLPLSCLKLAARSKVGMGARLVPAVTGALLVGAALLKGHRLVLGPDLPPGLFRSPGFQLATIGTEWGLGAALLSGIHPRLCRVAALILFGVFSFVNLMSAFGGVSNCACLGIDLHPWWTLGLDLVLVWLLWSWRPTPPGEEMARLVFLLALAPVGLLLPAAWAWRDVRSAIEAPPLVDLGSVTQGQAHRFDMTLHNRLDRAVTINHVKASCPCVRAEGLPWQLAPGEVSPVGAVLDLRAEPHFHGVLVITVSGGTEPDQAMFQTDVRAGVVVQ
jgi:hypothetical protein